MVLVTIDALSDRPIYEQIADAVRFAIGAGSLLAGEKLPTADDVATGLGVNKHTVLRAYQLLRDDGLVDLRRGRGAVVTGAGTALGELSGDVEHLARRAVALGVSRDTLSALLLNAYERTSGRSDARDSEKERS